MWTPNLLRVSWPSSTGGLAQAGVASTPCSLPCEAFGSVTSMPTHTIGRRLHDLYVFDDLEEPMDAYIVLHGLMLLTCHKSPAPACNILIANTPTHRYSAGFFGPLTTLPTPTAPPPLVLTIASTIM